MNRYLKIYWILLKTHFAAIANYRMNFFMNVLSSIAWGIFSIITILLLTAHVSSVYGWKPYELLLLVSIVNVILGIYRMIFDINLWKFSNILHFGEFDQVLLRPLDSQFQMSVWIFDYSGILRVISAIVLTLFLIDIYKIQITITALIAFLF